MKNLFYTLLLLITISGEMVHLAYMLSCEHDNIELVCDVKGENESEENKELGEDASEIPSSQIQLNYFSNTRILLSKSTLTFVDDQYSRISTPPPDVA